MKHKVLVCLQGQQARVWFLPPDCEAEVINLYSIARDPVNEFGNLSVEARALVADEYPYVLKLDETSPKAHCQNCGRAWESSLLNHIRDLAQRVSPGEPMPAGQCPICGALCHQTQS